MSKSAVIAMACLGCAALGAGAGWVSRSSWGEYDRRLMNRRIVLFSGGSDTHSFARVIREGARAAARDLGCALELIDSGWSPDRMVDQFKDAIAARPDAICIMGHPGGALLRPLVAEALRSGVLVTALNVDVPEIRRLHSTRGFGFVGSGQARAGLLLAEACLRRFKLEPGDEALVFAWSFSSEATPSARRRRARACAEALEAARVTVHRVEIPRDFEEGRRAPERVLAFLREALDARPRAAVLVADNGWIPAALAPIAAERSGAGRPPLRVAAFDLTEGNLRSMHAGYLELVHDQQPYLQGYFAVVQAGLSAAHGFSGLRIETGLGVLDREAALAFEPAVRSHLR